MTKLDGKTALVTGAARGIGRAVAVRLAADGARVAVHYGSSADAAHQVVEMIQAQGGSAFAIQTSLGASGDAAALWTAFDEHADGVDVIVNNAGTLGSRVPFPEVSESEYDEVLAGQRQGSVLHRPAGANPAPRRGADHQPLDLVHPRLAKPRPHGVLDVQSRD